MPANPQSNPWILRPRPNPHARLRLFCLPYAGGGASTYCAWPAHLPPDIEVMAVQLPGREERLSEPAFIDASQLCVQLVAVLAPYVDQPFALFGHSLGALVSFELARLLRTLGAPGPGHLFISGHSGPRKIHGFPPLNGISDDGLLRVLQRMGGAPDGLVAVSDVKRLVLPPLRCDLSLCEAYRYVAAEPLACPISAFGGTLDDVVRRADVLAWGAETMGGFRARMLPGGHFFLNNAMPRLLQAITDDLASAVVPSSTRGGGAPS